MIHLCKIAEQARSTYYDRIHPKAKDERDEVLRQRLQETQEALDFTYGSKRMSEQLQRIYGEVYNHKRIANRMVRWGLNAKIRRRKHPDNYYRKKRADKKLLPTNILNRDFTADSPKKKLVTDITYFRVREGWMYVSAILDLYNNEVVSYSYSQRLDMKFVLESLIKLENDDSLSGVLFHSDLGWTYTNPSFRAKLKSMNFEQSLSRLANPWDNAVIESFFGTLKIETYYKSHSSIPAEKMQAIIERYIDFYNNNRIQKKLGYRSPVEYRKLVA